jgi:zinc transport system substrate-binding protein
MRGLALVLCAFVVSTASACGGGAASPADDRPRVVAAFYPLAWAAEHVGGQSVDVVNLTPPGAEPHDVELSPRDVEEIHGADLAIYVGGGFQPAVADAVQERDGPSLDVLPPGETDPHIWLDPVRFSTVVAKTGRALGRQRPARALEQELRRLDAEYRRGLEQCARRTIVTTHAAFGGLASRYGLTQLSLAGRSPESEPTPRELERLIDEVRDSGATTVFKEPLVSSRLADTVARETGARVAVLDPIEGLDEERLDAGEDYVSVMRENLATLRDALGCR